MKVFGLYIGRLAASPAITAAAGETGERLRERQAEAQQSEAQQTAAASQQIEASTAPAAGLIDK